MLGRDLQIALQTAASEAKKRRHEYICIEHLLYALLQAESGMKVIRGCGGSVSNLRRLLEEFFDDKLEKVPDTENYEPQQTIAFQRVIHRAVLHAEFSSAKKNNSR